MTVTPLPIEDIASRGYTHIVTLEYTDFTDTAGLTKSVAILPNTLITAGKRVDCKGINVATAFAGAATTTLQVGETDTDRFMTAAIADLKTQGYKAAPYSITTQPFTFTAADTVDALVTNTTDNLTQLTQGKVHIFLNVVDEATAI